MSAIAICLVLVSMATTWSKTLISNGFENGRFDESTRDVIRRRKIDTAT